MFFPVWFINTICKIILVFTFFLWNCGTGLSAFYWISFLCVSLYLEPHQEALRKGITYQRDKRIKRNRKARENYARKVSSNGYTRKMETPAKPRNVTQNHKRTITKGRRGHVQ